MANEIKLITYIETEVNPTDDAYVYESAIGEGGIINGCEVTIKNASELHINGGNGILCGRKFTVYDSDIPVTLSSSGTILGRLYIHMDLSNVALPIQLLVETGASLTPVQQDADVNATNGVYEINLSTFNVDTSTISDLVDVSPKVYTHEVLNTIEECEASTNPGDVAGASALSELNSKLPNYGYDNYITNLTLPFTATKNCLMCLSFKPTAAGGVSFSVNGNEVYNYSNDGQSWEVCLIPLKVGDILSSTTTFTGIRYSSFSL